jgi:dihydroorotate dehydrogenase (NAD+) catalytic subunit
MSLLHIATVVSLRPSASYQILRLEAPRAARAAAPGQFLNLLPPPHPGEFFLPRPMSILDADPERGTLDCAIKVTGRGTRRLAACRPGDSLDFIGPLGSSWSLPAATRRVYLIGGGVGFAPLYYQARALIAAGHEAQRISFILAARSQTDLACAPQLYALGLRLHMATDDGSAGFHGNALELARQLLDTATDSSDATCNIQACGPMPLLCGVAQLALDMQISAEVSLEAPMACGVGVCVGCSVPAASAAPESATSPAPPHYLRVCREGPVFDITALDWDAIAASLDPAVAAETTASVSSQRPATTISAPPATRLATRLAGIQLANPVIVASGTFGYGNEYGEVIDVAQIGAITTKSISEKPRAGNAPPRIRELPTGMLNAIGLQNVGVDIFIEEKIPFFAALDTRLIANVVGHDEEEYLRLLERLAASDRIDAFELNLSCPNVAGGMRLATDPATVESFVRRARARARSDRPLVVKLTPNVTSIATIARAAEAGGADAISMINTLVGMAIDLDRRRPWIARGTGGYSGPGIKPVALAMTWQVAQAVSIPIIAGGGISSGRDACEFLLAGATAVSIGTATFADPRAPLRIAAEIDTWLQEQGVANVAEIVGTLRHR